MNNQQSGHQEQTGDPDPSAERSVARNDAESTPTHSRETTGSADDGKSVNHDAAMVRWTRALTIFTAALAVVALGTLAVTGFQLGAMRRQITQMKIANDKVERAVQEASRQAAAAEMTNSISREALNNANRSIITEIITNTEPLRTDTDFHININMRAVGTFPAIEVRDKFKAEISPPNGDADLTDGDVGNISEVTMFPGVPHGETLIIPASELPSDVVEAINLKKKDLYVHGLILYEDFSGNTHFIRACQVYNPNSDNFKACSRHRSNLAN